MALYEKRRKKPELMLVPLIDVLTMLIFFAFVTMQFKSGAALNITLPKVETAGKTEFKGTVTIAIDKDGKMEFNGKAATDQDLEAMLGAVSKIDVNTPVLIQADESTPLKRLAFVMDTCQKIGLKKFSIQAR
jgi:biopolymer transport protein ExbD